MTTDQPIYCLITNSDRTEGRGQQYCYGYSLSKQTALRYAKGKGVQSSNAGVVEIVPLLYAGTQYLSLDYILQLETTPEDTAIEHKIKEIEEVLARAYRLGLTDTEIDIIKNHAGNI